MASKHELVPESELMAGRIIDGATRLETGHGDPTQDFCVLQVKRREFEASLARLREGGQGLS